MKKAYFVSTAEYFVGYVYSETTGKAKSFALNSRLETDGYEFTGLLVYRCKALDSVFPKLSVNTLDPTENDDVKILKDVGLCVEDTFHCDVQIKKNKEGEVI
jgi:hypothetical protein